MTSIQDIIYKKITSLNPTEYTWLEAEGVLIGYNKYLMAYAMAGKHDDLTQAKTVAEWLETEV